MPQRDGCKKDVKRIRKYEKTGQWLCETCLAAHEKPPRQEPSPTSAPPKERDGRQEAES
ncbi:MAG: hypothetical protein ACYTEL_19620 [Planctomycetota bacterium]